MFVPLKFPPPIKNFGELYENNNFPYQARWRYIRMQTYKFETIQMPKGRYNQMERDKSSSSDKTRKKENKRESRPLW